MPIPEGPMDLARIDRSFTWEDGRCFVCATETIQRVTFVATLETAFGPIPVRACRWCLCYFVQERARRAAEGGRA